jgi:hypothetical protein
MDTPKSDFCDAVLGEKYEKLVRIQRAIKHFNEVKQGLMKYLDTEMKDMPYPRPYHGHCGQCLDNTLVIVEREILKMEEPLRKAARESEETSLYNDLAEGS